MLALNHTPVQRGARSGMELGIQWAAGTKGGPAGPARARGRPVATAPPGHGGPGPREGHPACRVAREPGHAQRGS
jgi:hypothetical protein